GAGGAGQRAGLDQRGRRAYRGRRADSVRGADHRAGGEAAVTGGPPERPPTGAARAARAGPGFRAAAAVLAVLAGLGLALLASRSGPPFATPPPPIIGVQTSHPLPTRTQPAGNQSDPAPASLVRTSRVVWRSVLGAAGVLFLAAAAIPLALPNRSRPWRSPPGLLRPRVPPPLPPAGSGVEQALAGAVEQALARLDEGPVADVIVACWLGLEEAAARAGPRRRPAGASAALAGPGPAEHPVSGRTLRRLAALYREARFSRHVLGDDVRTEARSLFERVRNELRVAS